MKMANALKDFPKYFRHECRTPLGGVLRRFRGYECPVCRAKWETSGTNGWKHSTDGTEGWIIGVVMGYPDGTRETFIGETP